MDPNRTLSDLLNWARAHVDDPSDPYEAEVARTFLDLDRWLHTGGFLPDNWQRAGLVSKLIEPTDRPEPTTVEAEYNAHIEEIAKAVLSMKLPNSQSFHRMPPPPPALPQEPRK